ncbi:MAG: flagellar hook-associated protein FlgL [Desulfobacteraceae bacterium]
MRIANKTIYDTIKNNLFRTSDEMTRANQVISSGKRINRPSDDPVGQVSVLGLRSSLANIEQLGRNITMGRSWLDMAESAMNQTEEVLSEAKALAVQMSNSTQGQTQRESAAQQVEGYIEQILNAANTQVDGRYIFSGTKTDTTPFAYDREQGQVDYQGNGTSFKVRIGKDMEVEVGRDGRDVFGDPDGDSMFKTLIDFAHSLRSNDAAGIQDAIGELQGQLDSVNSSIAENGARSIRLNLRESIIEDLDLSYTERKSTLEDADLAEAVVDLKTKELAYQAALASSSRVMQMSLVNYL